MRLLVTGGAGYIGSQTVRRLLAHGHDVVVVDDLSTGHARAVRDVPLIVRDVGDGPAMAQVLREHRIEAVIHFAALKSVEESMREPARYFTVNTAGTSSLLGAMAAAQVRLFVLSSTCAVYGTPDRSPVDETAAIRPENPYGESKHLAERLLPWFDRTAAIRSVALRYFNAAGAAAEGDLGEDWRHAANLVPVVLKAAASGTAVAVFGTDFPTPDGSAIRDYVHVEDLADAHVAAVERLAVGRLSSVINLGTGRGTSVLEVIAAAERITGRPIAMRHVERRAGDPPAIWASAERARAELGWVGRAGIDDILASAWRWHLAYPDGLRGPDAMASPDRP